MAEHTRPSEFAPWMSIRDAQEFRARLRDCEGLMRRDEAEERDRLGALTRRLEAGALETQFALTREKDTNAPLLGVPLGLKDNIDTEGELGCTAGSLALADVPVPQDAPLVRRLKDAGAVIYGKTNLSEWANFRSTRSISGWSSFGGQTLNPHALDRSPCGSSSGSGAAVAAGFLPGAVGTETDGSIICPAAINGIVGIKPTLGRVSRRGIVPIAASQDTAGPMTRTVADAALLLSVMEGEDPQDPATLAKERHSSPGVLSDLDMDSLKGLRLGYFDGQDGFLPAVRNLFHSRISLFEEKGAELRNIGSLHGMHELQEAEFTVLLCEFRDDLAAYLADRRPRSGFASLSDLIVYNIDNRDRVMPFFGQELFYMASETRGRKDKKYGPALDTCKRLSQTEGLELMFEEYRLDALLMPSNNPAWLIDPLLGDCHTGGSSTLAAVSGWPSITVPMGRVWGLPVGLSIVARPWMESRLIGLAALFESVSPTLSGPAFAPHARPDEEE